MTQDEMAKSRDPAAIFVNRITVTRSDMGTRISFAEEADGDTRYRSAVMLQDANAMGLRDLLIQLFPPPEKQN